MSRLPMLATPSTGSSGRQPVAIQDLMSTGDWVLDTKLDGIRAWLHPDGRITNRKGGEMIVFPEIENPTDHLLDGEIVALDGRFETALLRESQTVLNAHTRRLAEQYPCRFIAFDLPAQTGSVWWERRRTLDALDIDTTPTSTDLTLWHHTRELGMEGVIAKRIASQYQFGRRSADWVKFKHLHRVSCLIAGYVPGQGHRAHLGALLLALLNEDGEPVSVGRCGSGFTDKETRRLKRALDANQVLVAEIETVNVTSGGTLRFPVYRGLRLDVNPTDCTIDQLLTIPTC